MSMKYKDNIINVFSYKNNGSSCCQKQAVGGGVVVHNFIHGIHSTNHSDYNT